MVPLGSNLLHVPRVPDVMVPLGSRLLHVPWFLDDAAAVRERHLDPLQQQHWALSWTTQRNEVRTLAPSSRKKSFFVSDWAAKGVRYKKNLHSSFCINIYIFETRKAWNGWLWKKKITLVLKEKYLYYKIINMFFETRKVWNWWFWKEKKLCF